MGREGLSNVRSSSLLDTDNSNYKLFPDRQKCNTPTLGVRLV